MVVITRRAFLASVVGALAAPVVAEAQQAGSSGWSPGSEGLGPGISVRVIEENRERGSYTVRYPAGHTLGPHRHKSAEHVTVLSGRFLSVGATYGIPRSSKRSGRGNSSRSLRGWSISLRSARKR
jgi:hypothetical protein